MSNTKHTPGPWILGKNNNTVLSPDRMYLADVFQMDVGADQQLANAKLMAAAPDLLAYIIELKERFAAGGYVNDVADCERIIKKATE